MSTYLLILTIDNPVRGMHEERVLWIDSICINQADGIEKTHQVELMTEIYKTTWRGLAWLGEFEENIVLKPGTSSQAYRDDGMTMDKNLAQMAFQFVEKLSSLTTDGHFTLDKENLSPGWVGVTQPEVTAIQRLVSLKWFTRIWTVQEYVLPPRIELMLGNITCEEALISLVSKPEWDMLKHYLLEGGCCQAVLANLPGFRESLVEFFNHLNSVRNARRYLPFDLDFTIHRFRYRHCADPKDKVFALLGLTHPEARQLVNYALDKKEVYKELIRYNMKSTNSLQPLMRFSERDRDTSLPSWVPDLGASVFDDEGCNVFLIEFNYIFYCAPLFRAGNQRLMELSSSKEDRLQLGGRRVDRIKRICTGPSREFWQVGGDSLLMPRLREIRHALLDNDPSLDLNSYPSGGTYTEAFWRTCTCDVDASRDLQGLPERIKVGDAERVKSKLDRGTHGSGMSPMTIFFISHQGHIGIGLEDTQVGDAVYVLFGGNVPFVLRETVEDQEMRGIFTFVGHAYVHGIMDGEVLEKDIPDEQVIIV